MTILALSTTLVYIGIISCGTHMSHVPVTVNHSKPLSDLQAKAWKIWTSKWMTSQPVERKVLFVSMGNSAFVPFFLSWLCNTRLMQGVHAQTLILVTGRVGCATSTFRNFTATTHCLSSGDNEYNTDGFQYNTLGYWLTTLNRMEHILSLLEIGISVFVFEPDAIWALNALDDPTLLGGFEDIRSLNDAASARGIGFGWLLLRPTDSTKALFREAMRQFGAAVRRNMHLSMHDDVNIPGEQSYFNKLLDDREKFPSFSNINVTYFSRLKYPNGLWYKHLEFRKDVKRFGTPYVLNNNWVKGNDAKKERAMLWNHWFLEEDMSCKNDMNVRRLLDNVVHTTLHPHW